METARRTQAQCILGELKVWLPEKKNVKTVSEWGSNLSGSPLKSGPVKVRSEKRLPFYFVERKDFVSI